MKREIMHCADELRDPRKLVALYAFREGEERSLRYCDAGSAVLMLAFIMTPERGWKTRLIHLSLSCAERYIAERAKLCVASNI